MNLATVLAAILPFLKQELVSLEPAAIAELNSVIAKVSNPTVKTLLQDLVTGLTPFVQTEISNIPS